MFATVYAIQIKDQNLFKIGYAANPEQRLRELQVGNPFDLVIYQRIETFFAQEVEKFIHQMLEGYEVRGEWFKAAPHVIDSVFGVPMSMVNGFDVEKTGEGALSSYTIVPTYWSQGENDSIHLSSSCITASEIESECVRLMISLMKILVLARKLEQERMDEIGEVGLGKQP